MTVASAVDLGCADELAVDGDGRAHLRVVSGAVSLEGHGLASFRGHDRGFARAAATMITARHSRTRHRRDLSWQFSSC